jgi:hypothetical protein
VRETVRRGLVGREEGSEGGCAGHWQTTVGCLLLTFLASALSTMPGDM